MGYWVVVLEIIFFGHRSSSLSLLDELLELMSHELEARFTNFDRFLYLFLHYFGVFGLEAGVVGIHPEDQLGNAVENLGCEEFSKGLDLFWGSVLIYFFDKLVSFGFVFL